jgi:deoxyribodipyrimidine photolyase-related protein
MKIFIIFPVHLFEDISVIKSIKPDIIYIIEEPIYFTRFPFHKIKLCYHRATMKFYYDYLINNKINVQYIDYYNVKYNNIIIKKVNEIYLYDPIDHQLLDKILKYKINDNITILDNPGFTETFEELEKYRDNFTNSKNYYHDKSFYVWQRKRLNILVNNDKKPLFNKWSFDTDNRSPFINTYIEPKIKKWSNKYWIKSIDYINKHFPNNFGNLDKNIIFPLDFSQCKKHLNHFIKYKLITFGKFEDAVSNKILFGSHSLLSTSLNVGLITTQYVLNKVINYFNKLTLTQQKQIISSVEGFIRQLIGWRSFTRFIYEFHGNEMLKMNLLNHKNKLPSPWLDTSKSTGFIFIDNLIKKTEDYAYLHHIERLMYMGNLALITQIKPIEIYKWYMICFADSYEWVMVSNVMGMSQYSLKNISMMTRPYFSSSAYIKRMSNLTSDNLELDKEYKWEQVWNALYYNFIKNNSVMFSSIYAIAMQVKNWNKFNLSEKNQISKLAKLYLQKYN